MDRIKEIESLFAYYDNEFEIPYDLKAGIEYLLSEIKRLKELLSMEER